MWSPSARASPRGAKRSPLPSNPFDANDDLSSDEVVELYRFYGVAWHESPSDSGQWQDEPAGLGDRDIDRAEPDHTTRSEGDLDVGTARHDGGRGRLRRHPAQAMPAQREEHHASEPIVYAARDEEMTHDDQMVRDEPFVGAEAHRR